MIPFHVLTVSYQLNKPSQSSPYIILFTHYSRKYGLGFGNKYKTGNINLFFSHNNMIPYAQQETPPLNRILKEDTK